MIASVRGSVAALGPDGTVVLVGGVGLQVLCSPSTLARLRVGEEASLATSLVVREDSVTLYGFPDADQKAVFETLQTASGVGPRLAQAVLAVHGPDDVRRAIATEDLAALCLVPGIGRKGAQRLVLELKDRLGPPESGPATASGRPDVSVEFPPWQEKVRSALGQLGYSAREADEALAALRTAGLVDESVGPPDVAVLLRRALAALRRT